MISTFQKGFNYRQDGPGNRLVLHLQGCNMTCPWCANPEGLDSFPPQMAGRKSQGVKSGKFMTQTIQSLVTEIVECKSLFFDGGGVTFTGGEATLQIEELLPLFTELKKQCINIALETNGTLQELSKLFPLVDYLIIDCKQVDMEKHLSLTGLDNEIILQNILAGAKTRKQLLIRFPLVNGYNASDSDIEHFITFSRQVLEESAPQNMIQFELIPYHEYGKKKWEDLGLTYTVKDGFISKERLAQINKRFLGARIPLVKT